MAKRTKHLQPQQSTSNGPAPIDPSTPRHLLGALHNTAEKLKSKKAAEAARAEVTFTNEKEYRDAINAVLSTPQGMEVFKRLLMYTQFFSDEPTSHDSIKMIEERGMARLYKKMIRPYVKPTIRSELENL